MRPLLLIFVALALLAGCGGESKQPLEEGLSYLPKDTPFAAAIDTDVEGDQYKALGRIVERFPFGRRLTESLEQSLEREGGRIDFNRDVKPLLGNPFVIGSTDARSFADGADDDNFVGAVKAKDGEKLEQLVEKADAKERGEKSGAKLYEDDDGDLFAIRDDVLVVAGSRKLLEDALERRDGDDHLTEESFDRATERLPGDALFRAYFNAAELLRVDPDSAQARRIKWVRALRTVGVAASAERDAVEIDFRARTAGDLSERDLPLAGGARSPDVVQRPDELSVGLRDPARLVEFAEAAARSAEPGSGTQIDAFKRRLESEGVDLRRDVLDQLGGDVSANVAVDGEFGVRAELKDPARFKRTLARLVDALPRLARGSGAGPTGIAKPKQGEDFYAIAQPDGDSIVFGVVEDSLVVSDDPRRASRLAAEQGSAVPGAEGSLVISADAEKVAGRALQQLGPRLGLGALFGGAFTRPLGDLTGSVSSSPGGLEGKLRLEVD